MALGWAAAVAVTIVVLANLAPDALEWFGAGTAYR